MANELSLNVGINFSKGGVELTRSEGIEVTITGESITHAVQNVGTSEEELAQTADLGTPGWCFVKNLDATNYVEVGLTASYTIKLKAGEFALFRFDGAALYAKANTAACNVEYIIIED